MLNILKNINISMETWGVLICLVAITLLLIESKIEKRTRSQFLSLFGCLLIDLWCNIAGLMLKGTANSVGKVLVRISNFGEFFFGFLLCFFFSVYILNILGGRENKKASHLVFPFIGDSCAGRTAGHYFPVYRLAVLY